MNLHSNNDSHSKSRIMAHFYRLIENFQQIVYLTVGPGVLLSSNTLFEILILCLFHCTVWGCMGSFLSKFISKFFGVMWTYVHKYESMMEVVIFQKRMEFTCFVFYGKLTLLKSDIDAITAIRRARSFKLGI